MLHISCNIGTRDSPVYVSGKSLVPMLQLLHVLIYVYTTTHQYTCILKYTGIHHIHKYTYVAVHHIHRYTQVYTSVQKYTQVCTGIFKNTHEFTCDFY